jgi:phage FluMu protein Com
MKISRYLKNSLFGILIWSLFSAFLYDQLKVIPILKYLIIAGNWLYETTLYYLTYRIPIWWVIVFLFLVWFLNQADKYKSPPLSKPPNDKPKFLEYTQDKFKNWIWKWNWEWNSTLKAYQYVNLKAYCGNCNVELLEAGSFNRAKAYCPKCNTFYDAYVHEYEYHPGAMALLNAELEKRYPEEFRK